MEENVKCPKCNSPIEKRDCTYGTAHVCTNRYCNFIFINNFKYPDGISNFEKFGFDCTAFFSIPFFLVVLYNLFFNIEDLDATLRVPGTIFTGLFFVYGAYFSLNSLFNKMKNYFETTIFKQTINYDNLLKENSRLRELLSNSTDTSQNNEYLLRQISKIIYGKADYNKITLLEDIKNHKKYYREHFDFIKTVEEKKRIGSQYVSFISDKCRAAGYLVKEYGKEHGLRDNGIDIIAKKDGNILIIQCIYWMKKTMYSDVILKLLGSTIWYCIVKQGYDAKDIPGLLDNGTIKPRICLPNISLVSDEARAMAKIFNIKFIQRDYHGVTETYSQCASDNSNDYSK